ncbi:MAG TPA: helix-hairpin-helix domain-containing protein [Burkholderiaceae bacterium]
MLKKLLFVIATFIATMGFAFAQVDVNKADQAALDSVKGIGPKISKTIIDERKKGGDFKDWADFEKRVKGVGEKNSIKLSQAGLVVNGQSKPNAPAAASAKASAVSGKTPAAAAGKASVASTPATAPTASASTPKEEKKESKADKKNKKKAEKAAASASAPASDKK